MAQRPQPFLALISRLRYLLLKGPEVGDSWPKTENKQKTPVFRVYNKAGTTILNKTCRRMLEIISTQLIFIKTKLCFFKRNAMSLECSSTVKVLRPGT